MTEDGTLLSSVFVRHFVGVSLNRQIIRGDYRRKPACSG